MSSQSAGKSTESSSQFANINDQQFLQDKNLKIKTGTKRHRKYVINTGFKSRYFLRHNFIAQLYLDQNNMYLLPIILFP